MTVYCTELEKLKNCNGQNSYERVVDEYEDDDNDNSKIGFFFWKIKYLVPNL